MAIELIPNLELAWVEPGQSEPVYFGEHLVPRHFKTFFSFSDGDKEWSLFFFIEVSELGTPKLAGVEVKGSRPSKLIDSDREGIERWQLKVVEQYRSQLLNLAIRLSIETRRPTVMLRREYNAENMALMRALSSAGDKGNQDVLEHPSTITGKLPNGEVADFVRFWDGRSTPLTEKELKELQKLIGTKTRQIITKELLAEVADIYNAEGSQIGGKPVMAIKNRFNCSYRTAQDYVRKAREEKLLPPTTAGKVTVKKTRARKGNDDKVSKAKLSK